MFRGVVMREKQILIIPKDRSRKSKTILWSEALVWAKTDNEGLKKMIEEGIEVNDCFVDEAIICDCKLS